MFYIGMDDTDNLESRGTGHLAREVSAALEGDFEVRGITRHQLSRDERVPCTKNNSSACIHLDIHPNQIDIPELTEKVKKIMLADFQLGSDPGLCIGGDIPDEIVAFGHQAQQGLVSQQAARELARKHHIFLEGLGGTEDGVIGALCAVGLASGGNDGRYIQLGTIRELAGLKPVQAVLEAGIDQVCRLDHSPVSEGLIRTDKLRPSRRGSRSVLYVEEQNGIFLPLKLD